MVWNASDLLNNTLRGSYCEFVISSALGFDLSGVNEDWGAYDINFPFRWNDDCVWRDEIRIEVKSCAYLQAWQQSKLSNILFSIRPTRAWDPITGYADEVKRQSDVYVFCHYTVTELSKADPLIKECTYWEALLTVGYDPGTGKQIQKLFSGKTQKEVREKMQAAAVG